MAAKNLAKHEARTRVVFNLPLNNAGEENAFYDVIAHLQQLKERGTRQT